MGAARACVSAASVATGLKLPIRPGGPAQREMVTVACRVSVDASDGRWIFSARPFRSHRELPDWFRSA